MCVRARARVYIYVYTCTRPNSDTPWGGKWIHTYEKKKTYTYTHDTPYTDGLLTYVFIARHSCLVG